MITSTEGDPDPDVVPKKKHQPKKKQLYASILKQMEFYFSDAALSKDRFLCQLIRKDPHVPLDVFLTFNKIKSLTDNTGDLARALRSSTRLEISEDGTKVKRAKPLVPYDVDSRTIYVESIPSSADLRWLSDVFQAYGPVAYVSLPRYFKSNKLKGFAFVEFENPADADKCLEAFTNMGCKLPTSIKPDMLRSYQGFDEDNTETDSKEKNSENATKENEDESLESSHVMEPPAKKIKLANIDEPKTDVSPEKQVTETPLENVVEYTNVTDELVENTDGQEDIKRSKPVRKRKKKDRKKARKEVEKKGLEGASRGLQILSKKEWKVLRNKYLTVQRKHMKALKQVLRTQHALPDSRDPAPAALFPDSSQTTDDQECKPEVASIDQIPFVEGVIVTAHLPEPCVNFKELKHSTKANVHVKYVDVKEGSTDIYIRMDDSISAKQFASSGIFPNARVLIGEEEKLYWEELQRQQSGRSSSKRTMRGRDRLIKKAEQLAINITTPVTQPGRHIRFDD